MLFDTARAGNLTRVERRCCLLLHDLASYWAVARELAMARGTLKTHLRNAMRKLGARTSVRIVVLVHVFRKEFEEETCHANKYKN